METKEYYGGTYPEPKDENYKTLKVECYFTTYVQVEVGKYKDPDDEWEDIERQLDALTTQDLVEETDKINIDSWEEI